MSQWAKITYKGFYDVPRTFIVRHRKMQLLFDCIFDDTLDDYPDKYQVYVLPDLSDEKLAGSWSKIEELASRRLGELPVKQVRFDPSVRREVDVEVIEKWGIQMGWW